MNQIDNLSIYTIRVLSADAIQKAKSGHPGFPLGAGMGMAVGMGIAEKHLASVFNKERYPVIDHYTYALGGDGCMMEGISSEALSTFGWDRYAGILTKEEIYQEINQRYRGRISIISGGSDYHGDQKRGVLNPREIGECGLTEQEFYQNELLVKLL